MFAENPTSIKDFDIDTQDKVINTMVSKDRQKIEEWLGQGESFRAREAKFLAQELGEHQLNIEKGSNRALVLVMAKMISLTGTWGMGQEQELLMERLIENLGGEEKAQAVIEEGFIQQDDVWRLIGKPETALADTVSEVVDGWWGTESQQAQLRTAKLKYQAREQALINSNKRTEEAKKEFAALEETALAQTSFIEDLQRRLRIAEAGGGNWNDERKKQLETLFASEPDKVRNQIAAAVKKLDPINDKKVASQIEAPENLAETDKTLLEKFGKLEGLDSGKLVAAGISNEVMGSLAQILRLQLEQRRAGQETTRQNNREKKAVRDYFAGHEIRLTINNSGIADELNVNVQKAATLEIKPFAEDFSLVLTGNELKLDSVQAVGIFLDTSGGITSTAVTVEEYKEFEKNVVWDELFYLCKEQEKGREFALEKQYAQGGAGEDSYVIKAGEKTIGRVEYNPDQKGKLTINWDKVGVETIFRASTYLVNLIEKVEGEGSEIKGLWVDGVRSEKIKAEKEAAEKPAEKPAPVVKETPPPPPPPVVTSEPAAKKAEEVKESLDF